MRTYHCNQIKSSHLMCVQRVCFCCAVLSKSVCAPVLMNHSITPLPLLWLQLVQCGRLGSEINATTFTLRGKKETTLYGPSDFSALEWLSISGSTAEPTIKKKKRKNDPAFSDAVRYPSVQHRMSSETLLKTTEPILEKPEGGGDILNCQQNSAALLLVPFLEKRTCEWQRLGFREPL